jgi:hypothetical protein
MGENVGDYSSNSCRPLVRRECDGTGIRLTIQADSGEFDRSRLGTVESPLSEPTTAVVKELPVRLLRFTFGWIVWLASFQIALAQIAGKGVTEPPSAKSPAVDKSSESAATSKSDAAPTGAKVEGDSAKADDSITAEFESAKRAYLTAVEAAEKRIIAAFDAEDKKLAAAKSARVEDKLKRLESLQQERAAFEADGKLPESPSLKAAVNDFRLKVSLARAKCEKSFESAANGYFKLGDLDAAKAIVASKETFFGNATTGDLSSRPTEETKKSPQRKVTSVPKRAGDWIQLFNGKNLDGWKQIGNAEHSWRVVDGLLVASGKGPPMSVLTKEGPKLSSFHLRCEVMCPRGDRSGLAFRIENRSSGPVFYAATLGAVAKQTGNLCFISKIGNWGPEIASAAPSVAPVAGQWLRYEIIAEDSEITIVIDGKPVCQFKDSSPLSMSNVVGLVCNWQGEPVKFRSVDIRELQSPAKSESR